jgi:hypothetical protein
MLAATATVNQGAALVVNRVTGTFLHLSVDEKSADTLGSHQFALCWMCEPAFGEYERQTQPESTESMPHIAPLEDAARQSATSPRQVIGDVSSRKRSGPTPQTALKGHWH